MGILSAPHYENSNKTYSPYFFPFEFFVQVEMLKLIMRYVDYVKNITIDRSVPV